MKKYYYLTIIALTCICIPSQAQMHIFVNSHQPDPLTANAGSNIMITAGSNVQLGTSSTATGGSPTYTYLWSPATNLDNATIANPTANPTETTQYILTVTDSHNCTTYDTVTVSIGVIGINEADNSLKFNIYPNPNNGIFNVSFNNTSKNTIELVVLNNIGQIVYNKNISSNYCGNIEEINLSKYPAGLYIAKLTNNQHTYIQKINIQ